MLARQCLAAAAVGMRGGRDVERWVAAVWGGCANAVELFLACGEAADDAKRHFGLRDEPPKQLLPKQLLPFVAALALIDRAARLLRPEAERARSTQLFVREFTPSSSDRIGRGSHGGVFALPYGKCAKVMAFWRDGWPRGSTICEVAALLFLQGEKLVPGVDALVISPKSHTLAVVMDRARCDLGALVKNSGDVDRTAAL